MRSPVRAAILEDGLREAGFTQVERIAEMHNLLSRIYALDPDVILIDLENPSRDVLEQMFQMSRARETAGRDVCRSERQRFDSGRGRCRRLARTSSMASRKSVSPASSICAFHAV